MEVTAPCRNCYNCVTLALARRAVYKATMSVLRALVLFVALACSGCVCVKESSATATQAEIESRLGLQLHCTEIHLQAEGKGRFTGTGKNDTGDFDIEVSREDEKIVFQGKYAGPTQGGFGGSLYWSNSRTRFLCFRKSKTSSQSSFSTQSPAAH